MIIPVKENKLEELEMRKVFCSTMIELAEKDDKVVLMDADLMAAMGTKPFAVKFPERTVNCGVQEANMAGVAAGLAVEGFIPLCIRSRRSRRAGHLTRYGFRAPMPRQTSKSSEATRA